jgi:hypothetical protein
MNALLIRRQLSAPPPPISFRTVEAITEPMEEWWGIYYRREKIGYAAQKITPTKEGYRVQNSSILHLNLLETLQTVKTKLEMSASSDWTLKQFDFELHSNNVQFKAGGEISGRKLRLEVDSGGHRTEKELYLNQPPYLPAALKPYVVTQNFEPGREHLFFIFDPSTLSQQITTVTVEGREQIKIDDKVEPALRIRQRFKGVSVISWVDGEGKTLKEETPSGFSLIKQNAEEAKRIDQTRSIPLDLIAQTAVSLEAPIEEPDKQGFLRLKLSGFLLDQFPLNGGRQKLRDDILEVAREDLNRVSSYGIPMKGQRFASSLQSTPFVQSDHPRIRALAQKILQGETDALKAVLRLKRWVYDSLAKEPTVSIPNALEVLQSRSGDCNEHTVLFNALARAAGIPAKTVVGVVHLRGAFFYHAWSEVWLGEWVTVDSVLNQFPADVTHVKFLEGEIDRQIDILQLIGKLRIKVIEVS